MATNPPAALNRLAEEATGVSIQAAVEDKGEYERLLELDDQAQTDADQWIQENRKAREKGEGVPAEVLNARIDRRFNEVRAAYESFMAKHPKEVRARLAYGSFLNDIGEEEEGVAQWEKAREMDPSNPAAWNNLANYYGHRGPVKKAFEFYEKAMQLDPKEPVYVHNLAITTYLFRKDAREYYRCSEEEVFNRALALYRKAIGLDPKNFLLASDYAQSYYGIKPLRAEDALAAWNYALKLATDELAREGVYLHLARVELNSGRFKAAQAHLNLVKDDRLDVLKDRLQKNLDQKRTAAQGEDAAGEKAAAAAAHP